MQPYPEFSDEKLFELFKQGDTHAYKIIYDRFTPVLYTHGYKFLRDHDEVKDVIQDLFMSIWNKRNEIQLSSSLSAYLYSAAKNRILDRIAYNDVRSRYEASLQGFIDQGHWATDQKVRENELQLLIEQEIKALPAKMREVFELSRRDHLSYKQIAEQLDISDKTVKKHVSTAIKVLRVKLRSIHILFYF
jgi:RNA polymerase sigma-70 factor (ECF subfamily)